MINSSAEPSSRAVKDRGIRMFDSLNGFFTAQHVLVLLSLALCAICIGGFHFVGTCFESLDAIIKERFEDQREELDSIIANSRQRARLDDENDMWDDGPSPAQLRTWREEKAPL